MSATDYRPRMENGLRVWDTDGIAIIRCGGCKRTGRVAFTSTIRQGEHAGRMTMETIVKAADQPHSTLLARGIDTKRALLQGRTCCGPLRVNVVKGTLVEDKPCDARCMGAVGPTCECSCAGANHGGKHRGWTERALARREEP